MNAQPSRLAIVETDERALSATGVIDSHTASELTERLSALGTDDHVELDLRGVEFIDSSGLRSIITGHKDLDAAGKELRLLGVSDAVNRLLEITGLHEHLHIG